MGLSPYPKEDAGRLLERFGNDRGSILAVHARDILQEMREIQPGWERHSLVSGTHWAIEQVRARYPFLSNEADVALGWIFSFWWK
jgi:hypothetical protein